MKTTQFPQTVMRKNSNDFTFYEHNEQHHSVNFDSFLSDSLNELTRLTVSRLGLDFS